MHRLTGAIAARADQVMVDLPGQTCAVLPLVFRALVHVDAAGTATRRRVDRAELTTDDSIIHLIDHLMASEARLLLGGEQQGRPTVEVAHEALFEGWPQLRDWLAENRAFLQRRAEIEGAMTRWKRELKHCDFLLPAGKQLDEAIVLANDQPTLLLPEMQEYIKESLDHTQQMLQPDDEMLRGTSRFLAERSRDRTAKGRIIEAIETALEALPKDMASPNRPYVPEAEVALYQAISRVHRDLETQAFALLSGHTRPIRSVVWNSYADSIATASDDGTVRIWNAASGAQLGILEGHKGPLNSIALSPDGSRLVTASEDHTARLWDLVSCKAIATLSGHGQAVNSAIFSPKGTRIATTSDDGTLRLYDATSGKCIALLARHNGAITASTFSQGETRIITTGSDGIVAINDTSSDKTIDILEGGYDWGSAAIGLFKWILRLPINIAELIMSTFWMLLAAAGVLCVAALVLGFLLHFIVDVDINDIWLYMMVPVAVLLSLWKWISDDDEFVSYAIYKRAYPDLSALNTTLLMMSSKFRRKSRRLILAYLSSTANARRFWGLTAAIDPLDPGRVLTGYADGSVRLWDIRAGTVLMRLNGHSNAVVSATFSRDGVYALTASYDGTARLWNARSGEEMRILRHAGAVNAASFNPECTRIVTASDDCTARLWNTASGECLVIFHGHSAGVNSAVFSRDGAQVVTGADDCTARIWRTFPTTQTLIDEARRLLRNLKEGDSRL